MARATKDQRVVVTDIIAKAWVKSLVQRARDSGVEDLSRVVIPFDNDGTLMPHGWNKSRVEVDGFLPYSNIEFFEKIVPLLRKEGMVPAIVSNQWRDTKKGPNSIGADEGKATLFSIYGAKVVNPQSPLFRLPLLGREVTHPTGAPGQTKGRAVTKVFPDATHVFPVDDTVEEVDRYTSAGLAAPDSFTGMAENASNANTAVMGFWRHDDTSKLPKVQGQGYKYGFCPESVVLSLLKKGVALPQQDLQKILTFYRVGNIEELGTKLAQSLEVQPPTVKQYEDFRCNMVKDMVKGVLTEICELKNVALPEGNITIKNLLDAIAAKELDMKQGINSSSGVSAGSVYKVEGQKGEVCNFKFIKNKTGQFDEDSFTFSFEGSRLKADNIGNLDGLNSVLGKLGAIRDGLQAQAAASVSSASAGRAQSVTSASVAEQPSMVSLRQDLVKELEVAVSNGKAKKSIIKNKDFEGHQYETTAGRSFRIPSGGSEVMKKTLISAGGNITDSITTAFLPMSREGLQGEIDQLKRPAQDTRGSVDSGLGLSNDRLPSPAPSLATNRGGTSQLRGSGTHHQQ